MVILIAFLRFGKYIAIPRYDQLPSGVLAMSEFVETNTFFKFPLPSISRRLRGDVASGRGRYEATRETGLNSPRQVPDAQANTKKRILIVDDQQPMLDVLVDVLAEFGYETVCAANGQEAVEMANSFEGNIDAIILDVYMPVMNGLDALPLLKEARPGVPTVLCSGYDPDTRIQAIVESGVASFLKKPFHIDVLANELRNCWRHLESKLQSSNPRNEE